MDFSAGTRTQFTYDLADRLVSQKEYTGTGQNGGTLRSSTDFTYADKTNYLTNVKHFSPLGTQNIAYKYGNINNGEMPDQVYSVSWNGVEKVTNKFDSLSRLSKRTVNGLATNYTYKDLEGNKTTTLVKSIETSGITHTYEYDSLGNITSIYDGSKTTTYKYDALNQLVRADNPYECKTHIYTYENGNITEDKVYQYTVGTSEPSDLKYTVKYSYSDKKWADVLTGVERIFPQDSVNAISLEQEETPEIVTRLLGENAQRYDMESRLSLSNNISALSNSKNEYYAVTSDEIGNITSYDGLNYTWVGRQLKSVSPVGNPSVGATYSYNFDGQRIGKNITLDGGEVYDYDYYYNGDILAGYRLVITNADGSSTTHNVAFMYDENGEAFGFNYNGNDYYYVRNAQNDVIFISNSDNTGVVMYQYDAWGNMTACYDTSDDGMLSIVNPYTYRGYFYEFETNTYFLKSRYYNPELCRFISVDGYVQTGQGVLDKNMFAYCLNNPVNRVDSEGSSSVLIALAITVIAIGAIIGGIIGGTSNEDLYKKNFEPNEPENVSNPSTPTSPNIPSSNPNNKKSKKNNMPNNSNNKNNNLNNSLQGNRLSKGQKVRNVFIGATLGLAVGGAAVMLAGISITLTVSAGVVAGTTGAQIFAIGALAFNFEAMLCAPFYSVELDPVEWDAKGGM